MGLDTVELVMAVEEHFSIQIPDREAAQLTTVGRMHQHVAGALRAKGQIVDEEALYGELREVICEQTGVKPAGVVPEASFVDDLRLN